MSTSAGVTPFVYWAQDGSSVFLRVDLRDAKKVSVSVTDENTVTFEADGIGNQASISQHYAFALPLAAAVSTKPTINITGSQVNITVPKTVPGFWDSVTPVGQRKHWLKFDFNRFQDPDGDSEPEQEKSGLEGLLSNEDKIKEWAKKYSRDPSADSPDYAMDFVTQFYLFAYNVLMFLFHFYVLSGLTYRYLEKGNLFFATFWSSYRLSFYVCTGLQLLDVLHAAVGLTKSGWQTGLVQVLGRLTMLAILDNCPLLHKTVTTFLLLFVYFLIEQFRYPYYAASILGGEIKLLTWLRYSVWILLYPAGLSLEAISMIRAIPYYYEGHRWSVSLPNSLNFSFNFGVFLSIFLVTAFPKIAYTLLSHMRRQRAKKFADSKKKIA
uniref:Very-long-chain (3R)-3-hydroxyacyl-CoA dehydratase n=1 Tax=Panagrellus redivivus TaxID=6233 RepID=A0A7E4W4B7_PANRE